MISSRTATTAFVGFVLLAALTACSPPQRTPEAGGQASASSAGIDGETAYLLEYLEKAGLTVRAEGEVSQPFFAMKGKVVTVNDGAIQVFEYDDDKVAQEDAKRVAPDGGSVGTSMLTWVDPPHFYYQGSLIVLYVGSDDMILKTLEDAMGPQFAGR